MLDKQINIYGIDTGHLYSTQEKYLHDMISRYRSERSDLKNQLPELEKKLCRLGCRPRDLARADAKGDFCDIPAKAADTASRYLKLLKYIRHKQNKAFETKEKLLRLLSHKTEQNILTKGRDHIRSIREASLHDNDVISVFDSALTRAIGAAKDALIDDLIVVQIYYFDIFKDIFFHGFTWHDSRYQYFTSSAGQIRLKKAVFIKESVWRRIEKKIMCGLTISGINARGGSNVNKHLAYMALSNSATDVWKEFDIDKTIVVEDFETKVHGTYDFIDDTDYSITRMEGNIPITHTDGAGMALPSLMSRNSMFRAPWIKGLLGVFDFKSFIIDKGCSPVITDIYGTSHDVIREDIQIIFTKSQFKMWKFYDSWEAYKNSFKENGCTAGRCSQEEEWIGNSAINYQMLQTLTDITEEEIDLLTRKSSQRIEKLCDSIESMEDVLGVSPHSRSLTPLQKAVKIYPPLLGDVYVKSLIREIKDGLVKKYRSGKLEILGKYTFLLPDFYAACEHWFCHIDKPAGLLGDRQVYCRLFEAYEKLDCLRSPHLYKEHAIRLNTASHTCEEKRRKELSRWFTTNALYASTHDLISKLLQFDVDGDKSLVAADPDLVRIAERNMEGIVPLYYNMRKAPPQLLTPENIYTGLIAAFTGAPIGSDSNQISKIWNSGVFTEGGSQDREEALKCVKWLCMENNFHIDYAKTLYKPERPAHVSSMIAKYTPKKLPAFFEFAKDKEKCQLQERNGSFVNRIYERIPNRPVDTKKLLKENYDYRKLMRDPAVRCPPEVSQLYNTLSPRYRFMLNRKDEHINNLSYVACTLRNRFAETGYSEETIADMLVSYLYGMEKKYKQLLWFCYGHLIAEHLEKNFPGSMTRTVKCIDCGEWFEINRKGSRTCRCGPCQTLYRKEYYRQYRKNKRESHKTENVQLPDPPQNKPKHTV